MPSLEDLTTDQLLAEARRMSSADNLVNTLSKNPETREALQRLIKKVNPNVPIPELDTRMAIETALEEERGKRRELETKFLERDTRERLEKQRAAAMQKYHLTEAEMLEVQKLMVHEDIDQRIPSYDAAARVFAASKRDAVPTGTQIQSPTYEMPDKDVWAPGIGNRAKLDQIALREATTAWNEITSGKQAA
jgi:hypothetical protein